MSLYTDIKILTTANGYKVDKLYSVKPTNGDGDFTAIRNTTATYENSSGAIVSAAIDTPRLDYSDGSCPTILLEPASNSRCPNSIFAGAISGSAGGTAPTGWSGTVAGTSGGTLTVSSSAYSSGNKLSISTSSARQQYHKGVRIDNLDGDYFFSFVCNITTAIALRELITATELSGDSTVVYYVNGVVTNWASNVPTGEFVLGAKLGISGNGWRTIKFGIGMYSGNSFTNTMTIDLPQLEKLPYRTSFIPHTNTGGEQSTTRALDSIIDSGTSADFNSVSGTLYLKAKALVSSGTDRVISANDGTAANSASIVYDSVANTVNGVYTKAGVVIATCTAVITDVTATNKIAFTYEGSSFKLYVNGSLEHTISSGSVTASNVFNSLDSNQGDNTLHLEAKVYEIQSYSKVLTLSEVASL